MVSASLNKKIKQSIKLLQSVCKDGKVAEVCYSGGKDSDVILQLAKEAGINYRAIYKNTTIDPPGTIKHVREMGVEVRQPARSFFQIVAEVGYPNRFMRFCCKYLKEYKILDRAIMGIRKSESVRRSKSYSEPTECRFYGSKKEHVEAIYPILGWTDDDVKAFIEDRHIQCAPIYYRGGQFDVKQRLGCMGCPLKSFKKRLEDFKEHPALVKAYIRAGQKYWETHATKPTKTYKDVYEWFVREIFFQRQKEFEDAKQGMFKNEDYKKMLEDYFKIKL